MDFPEFVVALTAIIAGTLLTGVIFVKITHIIQSWIEGRKTEKGSSGVDQRLQQLEDFHSHTEKRLRNLETIVVDNDISLPDQPRSTKTSKQNEVQESGRLHNKLRSS